EPEAVQLARAQAPDVLVQRADLALVGSQEARERGDERGLARARRAHDHGDLAVVGVEVDPLQHLDVRAAGLEALVDAVRADSGLFRAHRRRAAGWLFCRMRRASRPEAPEITSRRRETPTTQGVGKPMGTPLL